MADFPFLLSHTVAKTTKFAIKNITKGGGTAAPGFFSLFIDKDILQKLAKDLETTVLITGTNGKTTTTRLVSTFFDKQKISYVNNRHGSNLERGLISGFLDHTNNKGEVDAKTGLFEVDEAALTNVLPKLKPQTIVITNLFRDQLDRYGEVDSIRKKWELCLAKLPESTTLILNADDPSLAYLGQNLKLKVKFFGVDDPKVALEEDPEAVDNVTCPVCHTKLKYSHYYISHQGDYACPKCDFKRPKLDYKAEKILLDKHGCDFLLHDEDGIKMSVESPLQGLFNVYNIVASYAVLKSINSNLDTFPRVVHGFQPAFGRSEKLEINNRKVQVTLAKNPTGFNEVLRTFLVDEGQTVLIAINDLIADGRDVSWLWDVDFEKLAGRDLQFIVTGLRSQDMGLRLKYALIKDYQVEPNLSKALELALAATPQNETLLVIPTYTAMLDFKKQLAAKGVSGEFWED